MRAIIQRVTEAAVRVDGQVVGQIGLGMLILLGVGIGDGTAEAELLAAKCVGLRIFADDAGRFDRSLLDVGGAALVVSQFTLYAQLRKGRRPSFTEAAPPELAAPLVDYFAARLRALGVHVACGVFGADMQVALVNAGPVTISLDTELWREPRNQR